MEASKDDGASGSTAERARTSETILEGRYLPGHRQRCGWRVNRRWWLLAQRIASQEALTPAHADFALLRPPGDDFAWCKTQSGKSYKCAEDLVGDLHVARSIVNGTKAGHEQDPDHDAESCGYDKGRG